MENKRCPVCRGTGTIEQPSRAFVIGTLASQIIFIIMIILGCWKVIDLVRLSG